MHENGNEEQQPTDERCAGNQQQQLYYCSSSSYARTAAACYYTTLARSSVPTFVPSFFRLHKLESSIPVACKATNRGQLIPVRGVRCDGGGGAAAKVFLLPLEAAARQYCGTITYN